MYGKALVWLAGWLGACRGMGGIHSRRSSHRISPRRILSMPRARSQVSIVVGGEAPQASAVTIVNDQTQVS